MTVHLLCLSEHEQRGYRVLPSRRGGTVRMALPYRIYRLYYRNAPNKLYIGSTSMSLKDRLSRHWHNSWCIYGDRIITDAKSLWIREQGYAYLHIDRIASAETKERATFIEQVAIAAYQRAGYTIVNTRRASKSVHPRASIHYSIE